MMKRPGDIEMHRRRNWDLAIFIGMVLVLIAFSTDLRIGLNLQLNARPDFQFFELVCILFSLLLLFSSPWLILRGRWPLENPDHLLILFLLNALVLAFFADNFLHNVSRTKDFFWAFGLYALLSNGPLSRRSVAILIRFSVLSAFIWSLVGIVQWLGWDEGFGGEAYKLFLASQALYKTTLDFTSGEIVKSSFAHGIYLYPQNFIYYLICPFFLSMGLAQRNKIWLVPALGMMLAIVGTLSKTFVLLAAGFAGLFLLYRFYRNLPVAVGSCLGLAGAVVLAIVLFGHYPFWQQALATFIWRLEIWADTLRMISEQPWILVAGDGTALLQSVYSRVSYPNPHNVFLYFLVEYGIFGAGLIITFFCLRFRQLRVAIDQFGDVSPETRALFWGLLLFFSMGIVDDMFVQTQISALIFFYFGLLTRMILRAEDRKDEAAEQSAMTDAVVA
jgi:O-antigen ligase